ncbi:hypothetical protein LZ24_03488, partial [Desulfobotulus alkaliphilus]
MEGVYPKVVWKEKFSEYAEGKAFFKALKKYFIFMRLPAPPFLMTAVCALDEKLSAISAAATPHGMQGFHL